MRIAYCVTGFARTIHPQHVVDEALAAALPPNSEVDLFWTCPTQLDPDTASVQVDKEALLSSFRGKSIRSVQIQWVEYTPSFFHSEIDKFSFAPEEIASHRSVFRTMSQVYNISRSVGLAHASGKDYDLVIITRNDYIPCVKTYGIPSPLKRGVYAYRTCPYRTTVSQVGLGEDLLDTEDRAFYGTPEEMLAFRDFYTQLPSLFTHPKLYPEVVHTKFLWSRVPADRLYYQEGIQIGLPPGGINPDRHVATAAEVRMVHDRYVPIDSPHHESFGHWVFDSAICLPDIRRDGKKLILSTPKVYKRLFCEHFGFDSKDIIYDARACTSPMSLLVNPPPVDYAERLGALRAMFTSSVTPDVDFVVLPRQTKENYAPNDRPCPLTPFLDVFRSRSHRIVHTDTITTLQTQIDLVNSGRTVIVTDGSPALVNAMFCTGKVIYVVRDGLIESQMLKFPMMALLVAEIRKTNEFQFIDRTMLASLV
jgi:hypothetical protein